MDDCSQLIISLTLMLWIKITLILGKFDNKLNISRKVFDLIYELNMICPRILLTVLPQLEFKIKSTDEGERMGSVSLLARMFSEKGSNLAKNHRPLWLAFLGRYNDISVAIRTKCVQVSTYLFSKLRAFWSGYGRGSKWLGGSSYWPECFQKKGQIWPKTTGLYGWPFWDVITIFQWLSEQNVFK